MKRFVVLGLAFLLCDVSFASAGGTLRESARRAAERLVMASPQVGPETPSAPRWTGRLIARNREQDPGGLQKSGMSKGKKFLIGLGIAAGFAGVAWVIDHSVEDNTPHSLGLR